MEFLNYKELSLRCYEFFEERKKKEIERAIYSQKGAVVLKFEEISEFDLGLADSLLSSPKDILILMEETLKQFCQDERDFLKVRLKTLPSTEKYFIRAIRTQNLGKLVLIEGQIRRKTDVRPKLVSIEYLCSNPSCSYSENSIRVPQNEDRAKNLKTCPKCKSNLDLIKKELKDSQYLVLEEMSEQLENSSSQPKRINIILQEDLVAPFKETKTNPGSKVYVIGIVQEIVIPTKTGSESTNYDLIIEGNYIDLSEEDFSDIKITKKEEEKILELAKDENLITRLVESYAPSIYGHERIKEAILLQLFGGVGQNYNDGVKRRGDIHILLIGDPGAAKSQMLKAATYIAPRSSFVSGKSASGVGLTATVLRDDLAKGWALEAGSLVLANKGLCAIDEMDKMDKGDTSAMHEALEQQTISIAKANIRATLRCETSVLGAANPKYGRFDPTGDIAKQINFSPALMSRFDLIFILMDVPNRRKDEDIATHILKTHKDKTSVKPVLEIGFLKKYIGYAKQIKPELTDEAIEDIKEFYVNIRNSQENDENEIQPVPITPRQLEAVVRLAQSYAKINLETKITKKHAQKATQMLIYCLEKIGIDPKTGKLDSDRITTGVTASSRGDRKKVIDILETLEQEKPEILLEDIFDRAEREKISKREIERILAKMKEEGIIYEPKKNLFKIL